ncbi:hypothetical protein P9B95_23455, partial [Bacillus paralicheniformis]
TFAGKIDNTEIAKKVFDALQYKLKIKDK